MPKPLKPHPLAELLPRMTPPEYAALKADVAANGQLDDIITLDGMILDGRHRQDACFELKLTPRYRKFAGKGQGGPLSFVCSKTIHRNLDATQKACAAALIEPELAKDAVARMKAGKKIEASAIVGAARDQAARIFGISGVYVSAAKAVLAADRRLFDLCFNGREKLSRAKSQIRRKAKSQAIARRVTNLPATPDTRWEIRHADCLKEFDRLADQPIHKPNASLVIADPPYNEGLDYGAGFSDDLPREKYLDFSRRWIKGAYDDLLPSGTLAIIINMEWQAELICIAKEIGFTYRSHVVWYETFGVNCTNKYNRCARHIPILTKHLSRFTFNADAVMRPSDRQTKYKDKRAVAGGKVMDDVWLSVDWNGVPGIPRLVENAAERVPEFPTQIPEALIKRIICAHSNQGDYVLDPFSGSGTTVACCLQTGRRGLGIEKNPRYVELSRLRCSTVIPPPLPTAKEAAAQ